MIDLRVVCTVLCQAKTFLRHKLCGLYGGRKPVEHVDRAASDQKEPHVVLTSSVPEPKIKRSKGMAATMSMRNQPLK